MVMFVILYDPGHMGISIGVPQARWMVFVRENPTKIRMMTGGTPILREPPISHLLEIHEELTGNMPLTRLEDWWHAQLTAVRRSGSRRFARLF